MPNQTHVSNFHSDVSNSWASKCNVVSEDWRSPLCLLKKVIGLPEFVQDEYEITVPGSSGVG